MEAHALSPLDPPRDIPRDTPRDAQPQSPRSILDEYANLRSSKAVLEAKLKEIEPLAIQQALDILGNGEAANGKRVVHRTSNCEIVLQLRTHVPANSEHQDLEHLAELIEIEEQKAKAANAAAIAQVEGEIKRLQAVLVGLCNTSLGKTENALWVQLFYIAAPSVAPHILPPNTICVSYIKKQSIAHLYHKVQEAMQYGEPGRGIFTLGFNKELGASGAYYTVRFDWRERSEEAEKAQLERIANFLVDYREQLIDIEGTREMTYIDGWKARDIQALMMQERATQSIEPAPRSTDSKRLKAAKG